MKPVCQRQKEVPQDWLLLIAVVLVTMSAGLLRFYHLETPSLWGDEILLPLTARYPLSYILAWVTQLEVHPPYLYLLIKGLLLIGESDFTLRVLFALAGVAAIPAIYQLGARLCSRQVGIMSSVFLTVNSLHIYVSRVVRPYSIAVLIVVIALKKFDEYQNNESSWNLFVLSALNSLLLMLHYSSIFFVASLVAAVVFEEIRQRRFSWKRVARFCLASAASFLPVAYFLAMAIRFKGEASGAFPLKSFFIVYLNSVQGQFNAFYPKEITYILIVLFLVGMVALFRVNRRLFFNIILLVLVPFAMLLALRHGYYLTPWHLSLFIPVFIIPCAVGICRVISGGKMVFASAIVLTIFVPAALFATYKDALYEKISMSAPFKAFARGVPEVILPDTLTVIDQYLFQCAGWYLDQFVSFNPLVEQTLPPGGKTCTLNIVTDRSGILGHFLTSKEDLWKKIGVPVSERHRGNALISTHVLDRDPVAKLKSLPASIAFSAAPSAFYKQAFSASHVMYNPFWSGGIIPTSNSIPGSISYVIENSSVVYPQRIYGKVKYSLEGRNAQFSIKASFDDELPQTILSITGPDQGDFSEGKYKEAIIDIRRNEPYKMVRIDIEMSCPLITPKYDGGNLDTIRFGGADIKINKIDTDLFDIDTLEKSIKLEGLSSIENSVEGRWRWARGPESSISFELEQEGPVSLSYEFCNPIPGQEVVIAANGINVGRVDKLLVGSWMKDFVSGVVHFHGKKGFNVIAIRFADWNHYKTVFAPADHSPYAAAFTRLRLDYGNSSSGNQ